MGISLPKAELIALCLSTFLYGVFLALVLVTTALMLHEATDDLRRQRVRVLPVSYAMLMVATLHFVVTWVRAMYGFIDEKGGSIMAFYADFSEPTGVLKTCCLCLQSVMGDGIIIWRLYIMYDKRFKVVVPALVLVALYVAIGIVVLAVTKGVRTDDGIFYVATSWITAYFSLTMATNVVLSGAIVLRILISGTPLRGSRLHWQIIFALVESCALYTLTVVAALVTFVCRSNSQFIAVDSIVPMIGIAFSLIVLQIRFHVSSSQGVRAPSSGVVWHQSGSFPASAGVEEPNYIRMAVRVGKQTHAPHAMGQDAFDSSLDMGKQAGKSTPL